MAKQQESGDAFARAAQYGKDVTIETPNGIVHSTGQGPRDWYRTRFDTLTKKWIPNTKWLGNRSGE
jgi:hypothetical protein